MALDDGGTILNSGTINGFTAVYVRNNGYVKNSGLITGVNYGLASLTAVDLASGTVVNTGTITYDDIGIAINHAGIIFNSGFIFGDQFALMLQANNAVTNAGTIKGEIYDDGALALTATAGAVFNGLVVDSAGAGTLTLAGTTGGSLDIGTSFSGFSNIDFSQGSTWTLEGDSSEFNSGETISGFTFGDTLVLDGFYVTKHSYVAGSGLVLTNLQPTMTLDIVGNFSSGDFVVTNSDNKVIITDAARCFAMGTRIATPGGKTPVECLAIGDMVMTRDAGAQPIRWIGTRSYAAPFGNNHLVLPIHIRAHALGKNVPSRGLTVSPGHGIAFGDVLVPAWRLVNGVSITQAAQAERVDYLHIELDGHAVLYAENCPAESYLEDGCRHLFHNAASYTGPKVLPAPLLPRVEDGFVLQEIWQRIAARAGILPPPIGPLRGFVDELGPRVIRGWAQDAGAPEAAVELHVCFGGYKLARVIANRYRADLRAAGLGSGCHAFEFALPAGVRGEVEIRRAADGARLGQAQAVRAA